ncbi:MAG: NAD(P)-dependent oxidoreductase [Rikenellaceae bacterium]
MKKRVLVTYNMFKEGYSELCELYDVTFPPKGVESFTYEEVLDMIGEYDALQSMFNFPVDKELLDRASDRLRIVSNYAAGYDNIDVNYATLKGVQVTNTPDPVTEPTADQALGLMLAVSRRIAELDRRLRIGDVEVKLLNNLGHSLRGATLGIVGMGRIGESLAKRAIACGMKIVYHNRKAISPQKEEAYGAKLLSLEELLKVSDVVSINAPYTPQTHHIISTKEFRLMKPSAILINTARGGLVDEKALIEALREGEIWGAGLDVFEFGHYPSQELTTMDNVVLNPHTGTQTIEVRHEMARHVSRNIINFFEGRAEIDKVNKV